MTPFLAERCRLHDRKSNRIRALVHNHIVEHVNRNQRWLTAAGALLAGTGMGLAAVGSHLLETRLEPSAMRSFETAVQFQCLNALGAIAMAWWGGRQDASRLSGLTGWGLVLGILLFSGSIYAARAGMIASAGRLAPAGGLLVILSWLVFAAGRLRPRRAGG